MGRPRTNPVRTKDPKRVLAGYKGRRRIILRLITGLQDKMSKTRSAWKAGPIDQELTELYKELTSIEAILKLVEYPIPEGGEGP